MRASQMDSLNCSRIEARFDFGAYFDANENVDARFRFFFFCLPLPNAWAWVEGTRAA